MAHSARRHALSGFTLVELMVVVAVVAILSVISMGAYGSYIRSSRISESFAMLGDYRLKMEQFKQDSRFYYLDQLNTNTCGIQPLPQNKYFSFDCRVTAAGAQFTAVVANKAGVGMGAAGDYSYSIDQAGTQNTPTFAGAAGPSGIWKNR